jgi:hypothetical protein
VTEGERENLGEGGEGGKKERSTGKRERGKEGGREKIREWKPGR